MTLYTVHAPAGRQPSAETAGDVRFVKEGYCWPALFIPFVWLLWHRMWLVFAGYLLAIVLIQLLDILVDPGVAFVVAVAFSLWFALEANGFRRWSLERRGLPMVAVVEGADAEAAERRFFDAWLRPAVSGAGEPPPPPAQRPLPAVRPTPTGVIGLFPTAEGR